jgi:cell division septation protein DedD
LLLLGNVGYFGWELNQRIYAPDDNEAAAPPPLPADVPRLKLLSELDQLPPTRDMVAVPPPASTAAESASATPSSVPTSPQEAKAADKSQPPAPTNQGPSATGTASVATADVSEKPVAPTETMDAPAKTGDEDKAADSTAAAHCLRVGPFESEAQAGALRDRLASQANRISVAKTTRQEQKFFWVYLEPVTSDAKAKETLEDLKSKGIKDLFMIRKGEMKNAISLGVFSSQDSVRKRLAELKNSGYQPLVVPRYENKTVYWLDLQGDQLSADALAGDLPVGVKVSDTDCGKSGQSRTVAGDTPGH